MLREAHLQGSRTFTHRDAPALALPHLLLHPAITSTLSQHKRSLHLASWVLLLVGPLCNLQL